jgi:hypothetical protein
MAFSDMAFVPGDVPSSEQTGNYLLVPTISQIDPNADIGDEFRANAALSRLGQPRLMARADILELTRMADDATHQTDEAARSSNCARSAHHTQNDTATKPRMSLAECLHLRLSAYCGRP